MKDLNFFEKRHFYYLFLLILLSYFFGFYLGEDSAGGGKIDLLEHEWGNVILFKTNSLLEALKSPNYESSRTPLFLILNKYYFFSDTLFGLRLSTFFFGIITFISLFFLFKKIFNEKKIIQILLLSSIILLSPYFRSSVFWANEDFLPLFFAIISLIILNLKIKFSKIGKKNNFWLLILSSLFAFLAFYSDQKYFFLPLIIYFTNINLSNKIISKFNISFSFFNFLFFIPTIFLIYLWDGIVPIESQVRLRFTFENINILISSIGIYFIPVVFYKLYKDEYQHLRFDLNKLIIVFIIYYICFHFSDLQPSQDGSGIIYRFLSVLSFKKIPLLDWNNLKIIYYFINCLFIYFLLIFLKKTLRNILFHLCFLIIYLSTYFTYQSYLDPLYFVLIFSFLDLKNINLKDDLLIFFFMIFYFAILVLSIFFRAYILPSITI